MRRLVSGIFPRMLAKPDSIRSPMTWSRDPVRGPTAGDSDGAPSAGRHGRRAGVPRGPGTAPRRHRHHFAQAAPLGDVDPAIDYSIRAAERAIDVFGFEDAAALLERALRFCRLRPIRIVAAPRSLMRLGDARTKAGDTLAEKGLLRAGRRARARHRRPDDVGGCGARPCDMRVYLHFGIRCADGDLDLRLGNEERRPLEEAGGRSARELLAAGED